MNKIITVVVAATAVVAIGGGGAVAGTLITSAKIKDNTIRAVDIAPGAVTSSEVRDGTINPVDLSQTTKNAFKPITPEQGPRGLQGFEGKDGVDGTNGVDGKDGTNGTDGVDGKDGVSGYERRSYDYDLVSGGGIATMTCPVGKVATGGGYRVNDEAALTNGTTVVASYPGVMDWNTNQPKATGDPLVDDRGWIVQVNKPNNVNPGAMTVFVVCETAPAN